ncbi:hypothetical protein VV93_v1c16670 [Vibrio vulnificus]|nr:hypothetical protein VV93_v1c16670 [Vibrio vulnificus]
MQTNAALRGECRLNELAVDHFHHQKATHTKNATRHESHLNALLCFLDSSTKCDTSEHKNSEMR